LRQALVFGLAGVFIGTVLALWTSTYISSLLYGLTSRDPATLAGTALLLVAVAMLAGYLPARRAALVDPAGALQGATDRQSQTKHRRQPRSSC
jgi:ABC-type antimicrobial peptide transport system permease subunit